MKLKPINKRVIIRPEDCPTVTELGIHLVIGDHKPDRGIVLAVADDLDEDIQVGDEVIYARYAGEIIKMDGEGVVIHHQADIWAVVNE